MSAYIAVFDRNFMYRIAVHADLASIGVIVSFNTVPFVSMTTSHTGLDFTTCMVWNHKKMQDR